MAMPKVKKVEVEMRNLSEAAVGLFVEGYSNLKIQLPKPDPDLAWSLHKAQIKAWRSKKIRAWRRRSDFVDRRTRPEA